MLISRRGGVRRLPMGFLTPTSLTSPFPRYFRSSLFPRGHLGLAPSWADHYRFTPWTFEFRRVFRYLLSLWYTGGMVEKYKRKPNTKCLLCGKEVYRRPVEIERTGGKSYCGQACFGLSCRKEKPCVVCNKLILSGLHRTTCSRACSNTYRAGIKYKIGRPKKDKVEEIRSIKVRLLSIRGKKCERCGYDRFEILQVHHKDRNTRNNLLENLELVCPNCHFEEHYSEKSWLKTGRGARVVE